MKVVYVGECDSLAAGILERLHKEEHEVYFLSWVPITKKEVPFSRYKNYPLTKKKEEIERVFHSIRPDVVIYAGAGYMNQNWNLDERENLSALAAVLEQCVCVNVSLLICFSSVEVYGTDIEKAVESSELSPCTKKGMWMLQEENLVGMYHRQIGLNTVILRLAPVFSGNVQIGAKDFLGQMAQEAASDSAIEVNEQTLQPVHVLDVADAVVRVMETGQTSVYNVCSSEPIKRSEILYDIGEAQGKNPEIIIKEPEKKNPYIDNSKIKKEQEWTDFWQLGERLKEKHIVFHTPQKETEKKKTTGNIKMSIRQTVETMVLFLIFCLCYIFSQKHSLFSQVDWLLIYVVLISLCYGVKQGALAVCLSSMAYLMAQKTSILEMTNFYSYAESVLMIVEFVFFGIVVGYTADLLREEKRNMEQDMKMLKQSYENLKEINDKNIYIKNEYEKRVLDSKTSLPRLHSIINRINVLDTDRIFMEVLHVVEELMHTDTVAVYRVSQSSSYLRLIASLNEKSVVERSSWNLKNNPAIEEAIKNNQIYEGDIWKKEPAIVLPISSSKGCEAVIVIKQLPMDQLSLYSINLLRTLFQMISQSMERALQYESASREQKYVKDTNILYPEEFQKAVCLAEEKKQREMADYSILKIQSKQDAVETYHKAANLFRELDVWGMDRMGGLYVLLENTSKKDAKVVIERLESVEISSEVITEFNIGEYI